MPLKEEYIYLAGFIDGEGCIGVNNAPRLHITNTDSDIIHWLKETFGGYLWMENGHHIPNAKPGYIWEVSSRKLLSTLKEVAPYLKVKQRQSRLVLDYYATGVTRRPSNRTKTSRLKVALQALNHKGIVNKKEVGYVSA